MPIRETFVSLSVDESDWFKQELGTKNPETVKSGNPGGELLQDKTYPQGDRRRLLASVVISSTLSKKRHPPSYVESASASAASSTPPPSWDPSIIPYRIRR